MKKLLLLALPYIFLVSTAHPDVTYTFQITGHLNKEPAGQRIEKIYVKEGKIKIDVDGLNAEIIDLNRQSILFVNYPAQTYSSVTFEELRKQLLEQKESIRAAFASLFHDQANSENNKMPVDPTSESFYRVRELGEKKMHQDWECRTMALDSNVRKMEICAASSITGQAELKQAFELLQIYFEDTPSLTDALRPEILLLSQDLFPIQSITRFGTSEEDNFTEEKVLLKIDTSTLEENLFKPPKDFIQNHETASF